jgi:hypothetical protein
MAGLDPAIHADATEAGGAGRRMDARVEPGHDDFGWYRRSNEIASSLRS